jgi:hypothetical protein
MRRFGTLVIGVFLVAIAATRAASPATAAPGPEQADLFLGPRELTCDASHVSAMFYIPPLTDGARFHRGVPSTPNEIWIDLSLFDNGFRPGTFIGHGPHTSMDDHRAVTWSGLRTGLLHFYRINARVGSQWFHVASGRFETPDCVHVVRMACDEQHRVDVTFRVHRPGIIEQGVPVETWLDLTLRGDGYLPGTFLGAGPFAAQPPFPEPFGTTFLWPSLNILNRHYWRTNTLVQPFGWVMQRTGSFLTTDCNTLARTA